MAALRLLIYSTNYAPELTGIGKYNGEMGEWLARRGHHVEVITAPPFYPNWSIQPPYSARRWTVEQLHGVTVHRVPLYVPREPSGAKRIFHETSFAAAALPLLASKLRRRWDALIAVCPPTQLGVVPAITSRMSKSPLVVHVQDLQVDAARALGMLRNPVVLRVAEAMERVVFERAALVTTISGAMLERIASKGVKRERLDLFPNWVDTDAIRPLPTATSMRAEWRIRPDEFVAMYAGNLGEKQGLEVLLDVAAELTKVRFVIVGAGAALPRLTRAAHERSLGNVMFKPLQPLNVFSRVLATADVHLVLQRRGAADLVMPSKMGGILAAGRPALATAEPGTELHRLIVEHDVGVAVQPETPAVLIAALRDLARDRERQCRLGERARRYAESTLARDAVLSRFEARLASLAAAGEGSADR